MVLMLALPFAAKRTGQRQERTRQEKKELTGKPVMWKDPNDLESRNLISARAAKR
jgi:hypothetical protein